MASVELDGLEAAILRSLIYTAATAGVLTGPDGNLYAIEAKGFDILMGVSTKLEKIPLPS